MKLKGSGVLIPQKREKHLQTLIRRLNINLTNLEQLSIALTHPSFLLEEEGSHALINNQRLEFLGDAVVDLIVGQFLYETFPDKPEGELTKMRAALVCESSLANAARRVSLGEYLLIGKGERGSGGANRSSNLADAWEAMSGAIYLELGIDAVRPIILNNLHPEIEHVRKGHYGDYKTQLQEEVQRHKNDTVSYEIIHEEGPDHAKRFTACVRLNGVNYAEGSGKTKKEAEQNAACFALIKLGILER